MHWCAAGRIASIRECTGDTGSEARNGQHKINVTQAPLPPGTGFGPTIVKVAIVMLIVEVVIMVGFQQLGMLESFWEVALVDAVLLTVIVAPVAYFVFIRPRDRHIQAVMQELEQARLEAENLARFDALTGILGRRALFEALDNEIERTRRYGGKLACLMLDLDHFKTFNDKYGHQFGDEVLRRTAEVLKRHCRANDIPGRYGGEEFMIVLPETGIDGATAFAERIRLAFAGTPLDRGEERITVSVGVAAWRESHDSSSRLVAEADEALFAAKAAGRNVVVASKRR